MGNRLSGQFTGLHNFEKTCYVNVILQVQYAWLFVAGKLVIISISLYLFVQTLFHNRLLRDAVLSICAEENERTSDKSASGGGGGGDSHKGIAARSLVVPRVRALQECLKDMKDKELGSDYASSSLRWFVGKEVWHDNLYFGLLGPVAFSFICYILTRCQCHYTHA